MLILRGKYVNVYIDIYIYYIDIYNYRILKIRACIHAETISFYESRTHILTYHKKQIIGFNEA